jgi:hypothetical protein
VVGPSRGLSDHTEHVGGASFEWIHLQQTILRPRDPIGGTRVADVLVRVDPGVLQGVDELPRRLCRSPLMRELNEPAPTIIIELAALLVLSALLFRELPLTSLFLALAPLFRQFWAG